MRSRNYASYDNGYSVQRHNQQHRATDRGTPYPLCQYLVAAIYHVDRFSLGEASWALDRYRRTRILTHPLRLS